MSEVIHTLNHEIGGLRGVWTPDQGSVDILDNGSITVKSRFFHDQFKGARGIVHIPEDYEGPFTETTFAPGSFTLIEMDRKIAQHGQVAARRETYERYPLVNKNGRADKCLAIANHGTLSTDNGGQFFGEMAARGELAVVGGHLTREDLFLSYGRKLIDLRDAPGITPESHI